MKKAEIKKIIDGYKPHDGFFDLSQQPESLSKVEYAKILKVQNYLDTESMKFKDKKIRENNKTAWENLKYLSGQLQGIIFQHWDLDQLN